MNPYRTSAGCPEGDEPVKVVIMREAKWTGRKVSLEWVHGSGHVELTVDPGNGAKSVRIHVSDALALRVALDVAIAEANKLGPADSEGT